MISNAAACLKIGLTRVGYRNPAEVLAMGELVISYPGNGGRTSVVFKGKPAIHRGEVEFLPDK